MEGRHQHLSGILKLDDTTEMKTLYRILTCVLYALILLPAAVLPSCTQDLADSPVKGTAEVTLVLDAGTGTKAMNVDYDNEFRTIKIYAYPHSTSDGSADTPVGYFYDNDLSGNGPYYCTMPIELSGDSQEIDFYVLVNDGAMKPKEGQNIILNENSTRSDIESYMFSVYRKENDQTYNAIPMSNLPQKQAEGGTATGEENRTFTIRRTSSPQYIDIEVTRAMARLRLQFAKEGDAEVKITDAVLSQGPHDTWLASEPDVNTADISKMYNSKYSADFVDREIDVEKPADGVSDKKDDRYYQTEVETYMLENFYGADPDNPDAEPEGESALYGYQLVLTYTIDGEPKTKTVYLPPVTRNQTINVRGTIEASTLTVKIEVLPWNVEESAIGWEPVFEYGGNAPMAAWQMQEDNGKLVPDPDFKDATTGDEEAACCYVLYPRYGRSGGKSDHSTIVNKSSYAAFYFRMSEPEGAVWEAYLTNTEDFCFNTNGTYDSDGDGNPDKRCAITGIAREEPYQIQIGANNAWTQASDDTGDGFEGGDSGWDNLTPWGERIEKSGEQYDIHTDLYIRISLDGGTTWSNLKINPNTTDYKDGDGTTYLNRTYWNEMRRFAGGDYYVRIWQLKAVRGEESFSDLVTQLESQWKIKDFWKGDSN